MIINDDCLCMTRVSEMDIMDEWMNWWIGSTMDQISGGSSIVLEVRTHYTK